MNYKIERSLSASLSSVPAALRITLTPEEDYTLSELRQVPGVPKRTRERAHILHLNAQGWNVPTLAKIFEWH